MPVLSKYFDEAAFRMCAFGAEAFASAPLHEHLGCGSSHSPEILAALAALAAALAALADLAALPIRSAVAASAPAPFGIHSRWLPPQLVTRVFAKIGNISCAPPLQASPAVLVSRDTSPPGTESREEVCGTSAHHASGGRGREAGGGSTKLTL